MNDHMMLMLLDGASRKIKEQRRIIAELEPKAHAYDTLALTVRTNLGHGGGGMEVDIAWELDQAVERLMPKANVRPADTEAPTTRRKPGPKAKVEGEPTPAPRRRRGAKA